MRGANQAPQVVADRAGGLAALENSLSGWAKSTEFKVPWVDVDVQRSSHGACVQNYDATFSTAAAVAQAALGE